MSTRFPRLMTKSRACCTAHAPVGCAVTPPRVESAGSLLDEHQHVQPLEQPGLHHQEVTCDARVSPGGQELPPRRARPAGCWLDAGGVEDFPDGGYGDRVPEPGQLTLDASVPPRPGAPPPSQQSAS